MYNDSKRERAGYFEQVIDQMVDARLGRREAQKLQSAVRLRIAILHKERDAWAVWALGLPLVVGAPLEGWIRARYGRATAPWLKQERLLVAAITEAMTQERMALDAIYCAREAV